MPSTENVGYMLIVLIVFTAATGMLMALVNTEQSAYEEAPDSIWTFINGESYTLLVPTAGRAVTWDNATDNFYNTRDASTERVNFYSTGDTNPVQVSIIRNRTDSQSLFQFAGWFQYTDFLAVEKNWGWGVWAAVPIPLSGLTALHNMSSAASVVYYNITLDRDYVVLVSAGSAAGYTSFLFDDNAYTIKFAVPTIDTTILDPDADGIWQVFWNFLYALGGLLFGYSLPGVPYLGIVISLAIWVAIFYVTYMLIVRGVHGGG